jgi:hypothetical protein
LGPIQVNPRAVLPVMVNGVLPNEGASVAPLWRKTHRNRLIPRRRATGDARNTASSPRAARFS